MTDEEFEFENSQWERHPVYKTWDTEKRKDFFRDLTLGHSVSFYMENKVHYLLQVN